MIIKYLTTALNHIDQGTGRCSYCIEINYSLFYVVLVEWPIKIKKFKGVSSISFAVLELNKKKNERDNRCSIHIQQPYKGGGGGANVNSQNKACLVEDEMNICQNRQNIGIVI